MAEEPDSALTERLAGLSEEDLMTLANEAVDEMRRSRAAGTVRKSVEMAEDSDLPQVDSPGDV